VSILTLEWECTIVITFAVCLVITIEPVVGCEYGMSLEIARKSLCIKHNVYQLFTFSFLVQIVNMNGDCHDKQKCCW